MFVDFLSMLLAFCMLVVWDWALIALEVISNYNDQSQTLNCISGIQSANIQKYLMKGN